MRLRLAALVLAAGPALVLAQPRAEDPDVRIDEPTRKAVDRALEWLKDRQNADGSWSESRYPHNTAITSYALLAFLSQGHLPDRGLYGPEVAKGARFLTASARPDGYLVGTRGGNMYCHGMATLALSQLYGMTGDTELRQALADAVELIVRTQSNQGGWRYEPRPTDADISVTIMQVMALRGAKNAGLHVPDRTMERALEYIERCYDPRSGGYRYQPGSRGPGFARTAAGICVTKLVGEYDRDVGKSVEYLKDNMESREHFFYGHYYAAHAMYQVGGKDWKEYYSKTRDMLLRNQDASGAWTTRSLDRNHVGPVYQTAIAVIVLSVPGHYLPIFQR